MTEQRKAKLTPKEIDYCLLHMIRVPELFEYAKQHFKPSDFNPMSEQFYAIMWDCALTAANDNGGKLPDKLETVMSMLVAMRLTQPHVYQLSDQDGKMLSALFTWIFGFDEAKLDPVTFRTNIRDLIIERTVLGQMGREIRSYDAVGRPLDILGDLTKYHQKLQGIMADASAAGKSAFPLEYKPKKLGKFPTNIGWFDKFMNGGQAPGEVYVLLGPTGLGKTTSGVCLSVETARVWNAALANKAIERPKVSCFFSWEQDEERLRQRFWSYAAQIDSTRLEQYSDEQIELSTQGNLAPYELELFADQIQSLGMDKVDGEQERLRMASLELHQSVRIFDFSGAADNPHIGEGGLDEVVTALKSLQKEGFDIGVVILDYANAAVRKMLAAKGEDLASMRLYLSNFCNEARFKIALPFNCPVWAFNQLNTEANRRAPTAAMHHSYASECGNFAENAWFAFVFGTKDNVHGTCQLHCTKTRRAKGDQMEARLQIIGNLCAMKDVSDSYSASPETKQIAPTNMLRTRVSAKTLREAKERRAEPGASDVLGY
jgi:hypothetical protein